MSYVSWKIEHTPFVNNMYDSGSTSEITDFYDPILSVSLGEGRDTFSFKVNNDNGEYDNMFNQSDKFTFYRVVNSSSSTATSSDVLMVGGLRDDSENIEMKDDVIKLDGYNYSETVMGALVFVDIANLTPPQAIEFALDNAAEKNSNFGVSWSSTNNTAISSLTFPTIADERFFNKPLKSLIEKYSQDTETNNGVFYWYVNNENQLIWRQKTSAIAHTFDTSTDDYESYRHKKDTKKVKNFIIIKGGLDPAGRQITTRYINWSSVAKHGNKFHFIISETNAAKNLVDLDIVKSYGTDNTSETYPIEFATASAFTTAWKSKYTYTTSQYNISVNKDYVTIDKGSESANKKAYAELIRTETKLRLEEEGERFAFHNAFGKLQVDLTFKAGTKSWSLGENILATIPKISDIPKTMRVTEIQYTSSSDTFSLEEDEGTL